MDQFIIFTGSAGKEYACNVADLGSIPRLGRSPGGGKGYPLQHSGLENSMDCIVHGVSKSWTRLSDFHSLTHSWHIRASLIAQLVKNPPAMQKTWFNSWVRNIHRRRDRLPTPVFSGFPCGSPGKESACNAGDLGLILGFGRSPGEGKGYPLQYSGLENSMDCIVHGVTKSWTWLNDFHRLGLGRQRPRSIGSCTVYHEGTTGTIL